MSNPVITNIGLVSRFSELAKASKMVLDGTDISADGVIPRGTLMFKKGNSKWRVALHTDTLVAGGVRIMQDDCKVVAAVDAFAAGYFMGFFKKQQLLDVNSGGSIVIGDLSAAAGFLLIESDEIRLW